MFKKRKEQKKQMTDIDLMEELEYYRPPKKDKRNRQTLLIALAFLLVTAAGVMLSPVFAVKNIRAEGASHFTTSQLCEKIGLSQGDNLLFFGRGKAARLLKEDPYIIDARLKVELPDTMVIQVTERKVRGYVPYLNSYLYIDEEGRVLDVADSYTEPLPLVKGLSFDSFKRGELIPVKNPEALSVVLRISQMIQKYNLLELVVEIDVSDPKDVYAYVNQVQIHLGDIEHADQKIRIMGEIMKTIPKEDRGKLDLSNLDKPIVFQYLT